MFSILPRNKFAARSTLSSNVAGAVASCNILFVIVALKLSEVIKTQSKILVKPGKSGLKNGLCMSPSIFPDRRLINRDVSPIVSPVPITPILIDIGDTFFASGVFNGP